MSLTARELNRATLARQLLLGRERLGVAQAVRRVVALQAQHPASPYVALWSRLTGFDPAELDAAFAEHTVVKATLMRMTLHAVHAGDYRELREAMEPSLRASRLGSRFAEAGLTPADADALVPELLAFTARSRTAAECEAWVAERVKGAAFGAEAVAGAWWGLRQYAPLWRAPTGGPWSFGARTAYVAARPRPALADPEVSAETLQTLVLRYLAGFGPASVPDMAQFMLVQRSRAKAAVAALGDRLDRVTGPAGETMYDLPGAPRPAGDVPAPPRLLAMWDSVLLAYADRSRVIPPEHRTHVIRANGDVLPTLLVDGLVAGVWRAVEGGIEATAFHPLPREAWEGLAAEAASLRSLLAGRDPRGYGRYDHWWAKLSAGEVRVLPG